MSQIAVWTSHHRISEYRMSCLCVFAAENHGILHGFPCWNVGFFVSPDVWLAISPVEFRKNIKRLVGSQKKSPIFLTLEILRLQNLHACLLLRIEHIPLFFMIGSYISLCTVIGIAPSCKAPQLQWNPETLGTWATPNWHGMFWVAAPTTSRCITSPARFEQRTGTSDPTEVLCPTRHPRSMLAAAQIFALTPRSSPCPGASRNRQKWRNDEKWPTRIHNLMFSLQNGSKHVKTCQNMSKHVKTCQKRRNSEASLWRSNSIQTSIQTSLNFISTSKNMMGRWVKVLDASGADLWSLGVVLYVLLATGLQVLNVRPTRLDL